MRPRFVSLLKWAARSEARRATAAPSTSGRLGERPQAFAFVLLQQVHIQAAAGFDLAVMDLSGQRPDQP